MKKSIDIKGMTCSACSASIENNLKKEKGVNTVNVNLLLNKMEIDFNEQEISLNDIGNKVKKLGYKAIIKQEENVYNDEMKNSFKRLMMSIILLMPLMYISMGPMLKFPFTSNFADHENIMIITLTQFIITIPIVLLNSHYFKRGFKALIHRAPTMDSLIALGSSSALLYGIYALYQMAYALGINNHEILHKYFHELYFETASTILVLISLGKYLEAKSKNKTSEAINKLLDLTPKKVNLIINNKIVEVPIEEVKINDVILIKPGESIPTDGVIIKGYTTVDQALLTGESIPIDKSINDLVYAGTINISSTIEVKTTKTKEETTLSKIIKLVEEASSSKAKISKLVDKISLYFVPIVIIISLITFITWIIINPSNFNQALSYSITVLIISCPCALGLATPVSIIVATGLGATNKILIKSVESLEILNKVDIIVLDKTGTITKGIPEVTDIIPYNITERKLIEIAAMIEQTSEHPLSKAVLNYANNLNIEIASNDESISLPGKGIKVLSNNKTFYGGNLKLLNELNIENPKELLYEEKTKEGKTPLFFIENNKLLGVIYVADQIKETSASAIKKLKELNKRVVMLTGDNENTANYIKDKLSIDEVISNVLPDEKELKIREYQNQNKKVLMVGDGINDSPSLVRADVGIAIGSGTDIAIESSDIVLLRNDLLDVAKAINLSKKTLINIKQNLFWAFFYNVLSIPVATGILSSFDIKLNPMIAALAMAFSSVFVVSNALRLKYKKI